MGTVLGVGALARAVSPIWCELYTFTTNINVLVLDFS